MVYVLLGLVLILSGIVLYVLWLLRWRGTKISDIPLLLDVQLKCSRRSYALTSPDENKWIEFILYNKDGRDGIRLRIPCSGLDDARIRKLTAALGRGKRAYSYDHNKVLYADFGHRIDPIYKFSRTVLLDIFGFPETARFRCWPG